MHRLCSLLGMPQRRFASVHVVGTNGKTSVARMTAALLESHGVRAGAYLSPHITSWRERILIGGEPIPEPAFVAALVTPVTPSPLRLPPCTPTCVPSPTTPLAAPWAKSVVSPTMHSKSSRS